MSVLGNSGGSSGNASGQQLRLIIAVGLQKFPVKTTDDRTLSDVLDEFLSSRPDIPTQYRISPPFGFKLMRNKSLNLPMTLPMRMIPNITMNSILMLVSVASGGGKKESLLKIALQVESQRFSGEFPSQMSLWDVLVNLEQQNEQNFTSRSALDSGEYLSPVIVVGSVKYEGIENLKTKKLGKLGFSQGTGVLFRLAFEPSGMAIETAQELMRTVDGDNAVEAKFSSEVEDAPPLEVADVPMTYEDDVEVFDPYDGQLFFGRVERCVYSLLSEIDSLNEPKESKLAALKFVKGIVGNIVKSQDEKYRTILLESEGFQKRLGRYNSCSALLQSIGFDLIDVTARLSPAKEDRDLLTRVEEFLVGKLALVAQEKPRKKRIVEEKSSDVVDEDVIVEPDLKVFRERVASAALPHPKLFVENDPADLALLRSAAAGASEKAVCLMFLKFICLICQRNSHQVLCRSSSFGSMAQKPR
eukprot:TRINITY_DN2091_c0_g1_i1.p1 TRINITY_DN2091_c0_g1~~TRINITY_DN2091_c0_g1_i1.p1  ORF type:complete len:479 (-),score=125.94 TRINITY_DN2091_c0_g1_i1:442-1857(-)